MKTFVTIKIDQEIQIHFPHPSGVSATLCGMDGEDDHGSVNQTWIRNPKSPKVNCNMCISIFDAGSVYTENDIQRISV